MWQAGQRVQIIKRDAEKGGVLRLGTEVVSDQQGTIAALLGASPGASTAAPIMLDLLEKVFGDRVSSPQWQATLKAIVPSYGRKLNGDVAATERELQYTSEVLGLKYDKPQAADSTPNAVETATRSKRSGGYCVVMMCHIRHGMPDVAYADKTRQRRIRHRLGR